MKFYASALALLLSGVLTGAALADSPAGTWSWTHPDLATQEDVTDVIKINDDGGKISGTYTSPQGTLDIENAKFEDGTLSFEINFDAQGQPMKISFTGKPSGDSINGTGELQGLGEFPWTPTRETAGVSAAGTWRWEFQDPQSGTQTKASVDVKDNDGKLNGTFNSPQGSLPVDTSLDGNKLTFALDAQGTKVTWSGEISGDDISGTVKGDFGEFPWTAKRDAAGGDVAGKWTFTINSPDGTTQEQYLTIGGSGANLTGTYEANGQEMAVEEIKAADGKLTFKVSVPQIGATADFDGTVDGGSAKGVATIDAAGQTMELDWTAKKD